MATIVISAEKVIEAAEKTIAAITKIRQDLDENTTNYYIKENTPGRLGRFFGAKTPTRIQAIAKMKASWKYEFPNNYTHGKQLSHAKRLLKLAQNGDPVTLNETDCDMIF